MDRPDFPDRLSELAMLVHQIPKGRCSSYGALGRALTNPVSGFLAGKWMSQLDDRYGDVPWWRVVKADGTIATFDRDPTLGLEQKRRLQKEGVPFVEDQVEMAKVKWDGFDLDSQIPGVPQ